MSGKERRRLEVLSQVKAGKLTLRRASELLRCSYRQAEAHLGQVLGPG